jgi:hypothetical protein
MTHRRDDFDAGLNVSSAVVLRLLPAPGARRGLLDNGAALVPPEISPGTAGDPEKE